MEETKINKKLINNTIMLYLMVAAKIIVPLISLPYLTRVLSVECYGSVSFVKAIVSYLQILVDFGFLLSVTKEIMNARKVSEEEVQKVVSNAFYAQFILSAIAMCAMVVCIFVFPILKGFELYSILSALVCCLTIFLFEYVFKAYEQMGKIAVRFIMMKLIALVLTIIFVKSDANVILIPIFDIIASVVAIIFVLIELKKLGLKAIIDFKRIKDVLKSLKNSFTYFISNFATTAFDILNTIIIGVALTKSDIAFWSIAMQMTAVVQALYTPITTSAHPVMIREKNLGIIHKIMFIYMPIIFVGCLGILLFADWAVTIVFTSEYLMSATILKCLIPQLIFCFPAMLYGWPCLDAINKEKEVSISTIIAAIVQVLGLSVLAIFGIFNLITICIVRCVSEFVLMGIRMVICYKNKSLFTKEEVK